MNLFTHDLCQSNTCKRFCENYFSYLKVLHGNEQELVGTFSRRTLYEISHDEGNTYMQRDPLFLGHKGPNSFCPPPWPVQKTSSQSAGACHSCSPGIAQLDNDKRKVSIYNRQTL